MTLIIGRAHAVFERYDTDVATTERLGDECLLTLRSQFACKGTDDPIA